MANSLPTSFDVPKGRRVLLVEDDDDLLDSISALLGDAGYVVELSRNGKEALDRLRERPADLVVLDLMMPVMDGWEFRAMQRADRSISHIPVVVMTADGSPKAAAIHARSFVRKPFSGSHLLQVIERVLLEDDREKLHAHLEERERLALLGTIAAGVGHEINNPLLFATGNITLVEDALVAIEDEIARARSTAASGEQRNLLACLERRVDEAQTFLRDARTGAERVRLIVRNLQSLTRRADDRKKRLDLREIVEKSISMAWPQIKHRASLVRTFDKVPTIWGSEARLVQVFLNLLVNAAQSIPAGDPDANQIRIAIRREAGWDVVEFQDTGPGMSPALQEKIFEPFFTTRGQGEGTGLGLAICREIVTAHEGHIDVESAPGRGSVFSVRLPIPTSGTRPSAPPPKSPISSMRPRQTSPESRRRVWIVDDEVLVANAVARMLHDAHDSVVRDGPLDVLDRLEQGQTFDVLVCDIMMPEMSGVQLFEKIREKWPNLADRIVFISGGAFTGSAQAFVKNTPQPYLEKPFDAEALRSLIEKIGNAPANS